MTAVKQTTTIRELAESAVTTHRAWLRRFFGRWKDPQELDDLVHELYLKLRDVKEEDRIVQKPLPYLRRVAYSVLVNWANSERRRRERVEVNSEAVENWANNLDNALPDDTAERLNLQRQISQH